MRHTSFRFLIPSLLLMTSGFWFALASCGSSEEPVSLAGADPDSVFQSLVVPSLQDACEGCHFKGGPMYASMPFDDARVIRKRFYEITARLEADDVEPLEAWRDLDAGTP